LRGRGVLRAVLLASSLGLSLGGSLGFLLGCSGGGADAPEAPPNVVLILTDDQGYSDVGVFGAADIPTPSFDRLADEGVRLTSFYTAPSCTPSRAMLLTGAYGQRVSVPAA